VETAQPNNSTSVDTSLIPKFGIQRSTISTNTETRHLHFTQYPAAAEHVSVRVIHDNILVSVFVEKRNDTAPSIVHSFKIPEGIERIALTQCLDHLIIEYSTQLNSTTSAHSEEHDNTPESLTRPANNYQLRRLTCTNQTSGSLTQIERVLEDKNTANVLEYIYPGGNWEIFQIPALFDCSITFRFKVLY